jgi:Divergent InlB B-repeat domain
MNDTEASRLPVRGIDTARSRLRIVGLVAFLCGLFSASSATAQITALFLDSQPGDYVGQGRPWLYPSPDAQIRQEYYPDQNLLFLVLTTPDPSVWWTVQLHGPSPQLSPGMYYFGPTNGLGGPLVGVSGTGRGCSLWSGRLWIREIEYFAGGGGVSRIAADFEQHCNDDVPALFGAIRVNSTISDLTPFGGGYPSFSVTIAASPGGKVAGAGIDCGLGATACSSVFGGAAGITLRATASAGYEFLGWEGSCGGTEIVLLHVVGPESCVAVFGPVQPPTERSELFLSSVDGDVIGAGTEERFEPGNSQMVVTAWSGRSSITFQVEGLLSRWHVAFVAPPGQDLVPGEYSFADVPFFTDVGPLGRAFASTTCSVLTGRFIVLDVAFAPDGRPIRFAADFEQRCGATAKPMYGAIRYQSTAARVEPFGGQFDSYRLTISPPEHGRIEGPGIDCRGYQFLQRCVISFDAPTPVALTAWHDLGFQLATWTGDCAGTDRSITFTPVTKVSLCSARITDSEPLRVVSLTASVEFPVRFATPMTWTATASRASGVEYSFRRRSPLTGGIYSLVQDWSTNPTYTFTPSYSDAGDNSVQVWVREQFYGGPGDDSRSVTFAVDPGPLPQITSFSTDVTLPAVANSGPITWTAVVTGGLPPLYYIFWRHDGDGWKLVQSGPSNQYTWTPREADSGEHTIQVWVKSTLSLASYEAWAGMTFTITVPPPLRVTSLAASTTPIVAGTTVQWSASTSGGSGPIQYQFWRLDVTGWRIVQAYGPNNTYTWSTTAADIGMHALQVWVRSASSTSSYDAWSGTGYFTVDAPRVTAVALRMAPAPPIAVETTVTLTATAMATGAAEYEFWRLDGGTWRIVQPYGPSASYSWTPSFADTGSHVIQVWARAVGSVAGYEAWASTDWFEVVTPHVTSVTVLADTQFPASARTPITWTAHATGSTSATTYAFWIYKVGTGWSLMRDYAADPVFTWSPADAGTYVLQVWAGDAGSTSSYDVWTGTGYFEIRP